MDVIPGILEAATGSVLLEHQYIHSQQDQIVRLLTAIKKAKDKNRKLDVQIILGKIFSAADYKAEVNNIANLQEKFRLALGQNIRYIDTQRLVHCHNKLIIVDGTEVLVSSQNWSNAGVSSNRETGLLIHFPALAQYYTEIFEVDWSTAVKKIPQPGPATVAVEALTSGGFVKVSAADYQDV
jgi:phosphatidylserine/phosphatidylglycerophosphate/cardiolipin synthase-like enzyme